MTTPDTPAPAFEVKEGRVFIDGVDVTEVARPEGDDAPEEIPVKEPDADNAALEGDEAKEPEGEKEPVEGEAKGEPPAEAPDKEPESPKEPEEITKLKFKLKFRGKEDEVEYDPSQIQVRLNKLRAFEENEKEFWEQRKEVEPYAPIVKSDWFKAKLAEAYESGELTRPEAPPAPPTSVQYEVIRRKADPDYDVVMESLRDYARNLPAEAVGILNTDATVFLSEYDRVATELRKKPAATVPDKKEPDKVDPKDFKAKLALKESAKSRAGVAQPGTMTEPQSERAAFTKRIKELERTMRDPAQAHRNIECAAEIIMLRQQLPTT